MRDEKSALAAAAAWLDRRAGEFWAADGQSLVLAAVCAAVVLGLVLVALRGPPCMSCQN